MRHEDLIQRFSTSTENQEKAIFNTIFIVGNKLQTLFDQRIPGITLKQFMLLSIARQSAEPLTFTQTGELLGCSRQNVKKLAEILQEKGFVRIEQSPRDPRAMCLRPTPRAEAFFNEDFARCRQELRYLFEVYSEEETETLFALMAKLYAGIENLERKTGS